MTLEFTYGLNGWHPHVHVIEFFEIEPSLEQCSALRIAYYDYMKRFYDSRGFPGLSLVHGVKVEQVTLGGEVLARYITKLQEGSDFAQAWLMSLQDWI